MSNTKSRFKKGATSIYVVVIATLLFSVITVSFIRIIINEANNTLSDELAQAAYDSALAGVEDAKTALKQYYECVEAESTTGKCATVRPAFEDHGFVEDDYCDAVSEALGRIGTGADKEVLIKEDYMPSSGSGDEYIVQAYTCVLVDNTPSDYLASLGDGHTIRVIPLKTQNPDSITGVRIRWHKQESSSNFNYAYDSKKFIPLGNGQAPNPPTLSAQIIQTAQVFSFAQFDNTVGESTNRGTVILVPSKKNTAINHISKSVLLASNNHDYNRTDSNTPQTIKCENSALSDQYACVASIEIPTPVATDGDNSRNQDTFFLVLSLPYGEPATDVSVQLCTDTAESGSNHRGDCRNNDGSEAIADFLDVQIAVDSTGRANDMFSRVEARVEFLDTEFPYPEFALQASGNDDDAIKKNFYVTQNCITVTATGELQPCSSDTGPGN